METTRSGMAGSLFILKVQTLTLLESAGCSNASNIIIIQPAVERKFKIVYVFQYLSKI